MESLQVTSSITQDAAVPLEWRVGDLILNTYEVKQIFTTGGMALVYRVHHRGWGIDLAVKSPRQEFLDLEGSVDNIVEEAETWVNLGLYPHIVSCYYVRVLGKVPRIFMEYVDGGSLAEAIDQRRLYLGNPDEVLKRMLDLAVQCAWGLHYAHEKGLIHQDMKPPNVLINREGIAKVTDFGIAQANAKTQLQGGGSAHLLENDSGTKSIRVDTLGMTPAYCSPEQAAMERLSRRTDLWSWALTVFEMFAGDKVWGKGPYAMQGLEQYLIGGPQYPAIPRMPEGLIALLRECFQNNPDNRPKDMGVAARRMQEIYSEATGAPYPRPEPRIDTILADTLNNRAISLIDLNRTDEAIRTLDQAIQAEPHHPAALYNRSLIQWRSSKLTDQEVIATLREALRGQEDNWYPYYLLGLAHLECGDAAEAGRIVEAALGRFGDLGPVKNLSALTQRISQNGGGSLRVFHGNQTPVNSVVFNREGDLALSGGNDGIVRLWRVGTGECLKTLTGHSHLAHAVRFSPGGGFALSASWDHTLRLWHLPSETCVKVFEGHTDLVQDCAFLPDGKRALSASADGTLRLWDLQEGACLKVLTGHRDSVWSLAVSPDGRYAVSIAFDNTLRRWDLERGACVASLDWIRSCTSNLALLPDGLSVVLAAGDNHLYRLDLATGRILQTYRGHPNGVTCVAITPNSAWVLSGGIDGTVRQWDRVSGRCLRTYIGHTSPVSCVSVCATKMLAISGGSDQAIRVWRLGAGRSAPYVTVQPRSSQEALGLSSQLDGVLSEAEAQYRQGDYPGALQTLTQARQNPEYRRIPRLVADWNRLGQKLVRQGLSAAWLVQSFRPHPERANTVLFSEDPRIGLTGGEEGSVKLWNLERGQEIRPLDGHTGPVRSVALSIAQNLALSAGGDGQVRLWRLDGGECRAVLAGHTSEVNALALSPDCRLALTGSNDRTARLWDLKDGCSLRLLKGHTHYVRAVAFTPDGLRAVTASWDKTLRLWDLPSGESLRVMAGHDEVIDALAVSPDGRLAVSGGLDRSLRVWDLEAGETVRVIDEAPWAIRALTFSPDGRTLFSGEEDGSIEVWNITDGKRARVLKAHNQPVLSLALSPDGSWLASTSSDHLLKLWRLDWEYGLPEEKPIDPALAGLLGAFVRRHRPLAPDGVGRTGKPAWEPAEWVAFLKELGYRGYGYLPEGEVQARVMQAARQLEG